MMRFHKYHGAGNDFLLFDGRSELPFALDDHELIAQLCRRRVGVGADGVMVLTLSQGYDFEMHYFNADGYSGSMCGNGGRCIVAFAQALGLRPADPNGMYSFLAVDGPHRAIITADGQVELEMQAVSSIEHIGKDCVLDTGSPHYIQWVSDVDGLDVFTAGRNIRYAATYAAQGINVNFVQRLADDELMIRTYERGVEAETYACGTGVTAAAIAQIEDRSAGDYVVNVAAKGGDLSVRLHWDGESATDIWLIGPAQQVFSGDI